VGKRREDTGERVGSRGSWRHSWKGNMGRGKKNEKKESSRNRWNPDGSVDICRKRSKK